MRRYRAQARPENYCIGCETAARCFVGCRSGADEEQHKPVLVPDEQVGLWEQQSPNAFDGAVELRRGSAADDLKAHRRYLPNDPGTGGFLPHLGSSSAPLLQ